jgi:hypothetical protein
MRDPETGKAVQVLDLLLDYFGEEGAHWTSGRYHTATVGAASSVLWIICAANTASRARARSTFYKRHCPIARAG